MAGDVEDERLCGSCGQAYCSHACKEEAKSQYHDAICELGKEVREMEVHCSKGTDDWPLLVVCCVPTQSLTPHIHTHTHADKRKFPLLAMRTMARILLNFRYSLHLSLSLYLGGC
jgi:hypothetical protein